MIPYQTCIIPFLNHMFFAILYSHVCASYLRTEGFLWAFCCKWSPHRFEALQNRCPRCNPVKPLRRCWTASVSFLRWCQSFCAVKRLFHKRPLAPHQRATLFRKKNLGSKWNSGFLMLLAKHPTRPIPACISPFLGKTYLTFPDYHVKMLPIW